MRNLKISNKNDYQKLRIHFIIDCLLLSRDPYLDKLGKELFVLDELSLVVKQFLSLSLPTDEHQNSYAENFPRFLSSKVELLC